MRATLQRVALAVVALAIVAWLAGNLRSLDQADDAAVALARASATGASPAELSRAGEGFVRARRFGDDTALRIRQARVLVYGRDAPQTLPLLEQAVRDEPENADAWVLLYAATRRADPDRAAQARARAVDLDPRLRAVLERSGG